MRNILMTVMMLIVVVLLFTSIITSNGGTKDLIQSKGTEINNSISKLIKAPTE